MTRYRHWWTTKEIRYMQTLWGKSYSVETITLMVNAEFGIKASVSSVRGVMQRNRPFFPYRDNVGPRGPYKKRAKPNVQLTPPAPAAIL